MINKWLLGLAQSHLQIALQVFFAENAMWIGLQNILRCEKNGHSNSNKKS